MTAGEHAPSRSGTRRAVAEWPGLRTLRNPRFRIVLAATLLVIAAALLFMLLARQAVDPAGQYGIDFQYWHAAARDAAAGRSPYPARYLEAPVEATDFGYKYPPAFAQALLPLAGAPLAIATHVWAAVQTALAFAAVWLAGSYGGGRRSVERLLWSGVATALFLPVWDSVWKGNVSAVQAFQLALVLGAGAVAGAGLASAILLKTTPLALLPPAVARGGRLLWTTVIAGIALALVSVAAAPAAWIDFVRIQSNLLTGPSVSPTNLAPASMAALAVPDLPQLATMARAAALLTGVAAVIVAAFVARRPTGWPAAVVLGTVAILLVPGVAWYHYLAMLLPLAAFAWSRATAGQRAGLLCSAAAVTIGLAWLPLAVLGAVGMVCLALLVVWPSPARVVSASAPPRTG